MPKTDEKFLVDRLEMTETEGFIDLVVFLTTSYLQTLLTHGQEAI